MHLNLIEIHRRRLHVTPIAAMCHSTCVIFKITRFSSGGVSALQTFFSSHGPHPLPRKRALSRKEGLCKGLLDVKLARNNRSSSQENCRFAPIQSIGRDIEHSSLGSGNDRSSQNRRNLCANTLGYIHLLYFYCQPGLFK